MREHLRAGAHADRVAADHPRRVLAELPATDGVDAEQNAGEHRRAEDQTEPEDDPAVTDGPRIVQRHPQAAERDHEPADHQRASGHPMPVGPALPELRPELKSTDDPEHARA